MIRILKQIGLVLCSMCLCGVINAVEQTEEVVVTASRITKPVNDVPGAVTVISRNDILARNTSDLACALSDAPSVKIMRYGSLGSLSTIDIRGLRSQHTLVMVDDRMINDPAIGSADLSSLSSDNVERIEIVRGPYSALYGANAVSGVVNIITKTPPRDAAMSVSTLYGTYRTAVNRIEGGQTYENSGYLFNTNYKTSQGHRNNSDYNSTNSTLRFNYQDKTFGGVNSPLNMSIDMGYYQSETRLPGSRPAIDPARRTASQVALGNDGVSSLSDFGSNQKSYINTLLNIGDIKIHGTFNNWDDANHQEWISANRISRENKYHTESSTLEATYTNKIMTYGQLTFGAVGESNRYKVGSQELDTVTQVLTPQDWRAHRSVYSGFIQDELNLGRVILTLGGRVDNPSDFKGQFSARANALYRLTPVLSLRASYGDSYRAPSLNDLYWPQDAFSEGNRNLKPEKGNTAEVGVDYTIRRGITAKASLFAQTLDDMIAWSPNGTMGPWGNRWTPTNLNRAKVNGLELEVRASIIKDIEFKLNYTLLDAIQTNQELIDAMLNTMAPSTRHLAYTPARKMDLGTEFKNIGGMEKLMLDFNIQYNSERFQYYSDYTAWPAVTTLAKTLPGYWLVNLKIRRASKNMDIYFGVDNLTDKAYGVQFGSSIDDRDYPMPGRSYTAGLDFRF